METIQGLNFMMLFYVCFAIIFGYTAIRLINLITSHLFNKVIKKTDEILSPKELEEKFLKRTEINGIFDGFCQNCQNHDLVNSILHIKTKLDKKASKADVNDIKQILMIMAPKVGVPNEELVSLVKTRRETDKD